MRQPWEWSKNHRTALFGETFSCSYSLCRWESFWGWSFLRSLRLCCLLLLGNPTLFLVFFPDTVLLTVGFFVVCQILVGVGNVRILNKSRIIELMTANRQNEKPLHKSRWMPMICIFYGIMLLWMLEVGAVKYHFYFDPRHPLPVKLMYWGMSFSLP